MADIPATNIRRFWFTLHRWIGASLAALLIPISLSGALLVWHEQIEALLNPQRYAVTGSQILPPSAYLESAARSLEGGATPISVRLPGQASPVIVAARGRDAEGRPRLMNVYIDPPTARVLDIVDFRSTFFGVLHRFHENLTVPDYSGRAIVGWGRCRHGDTGVDGHLALVAARHQQLCARSALGALPALHLQSPSPAGVLDIDSPWRWSHSPESIWPFHKPRAT